LLADIGSGLFVVGCIDQLAVGRHLFTSTYTVCVLCGRGYIHLFIAMYVGPRWQAFAAFVGICYCARRRMCGAVCCLYLGKRFAAGVMADDILAYTTFSYRRKIDMLSYINI